MTTLHPRSTGTLAGPDNGSVSTSAPGPAKRAYLHHLDLVRATTFGLVIFVHCLTQTTDQFASMPVNMAALLLHFTRNTFFALTGFVLMYQNFEKSDFRALTFWRRRIKLVIFPYLIWSVVYWVVQTMWGSGRFGEIPSSLGEFGRALGWGTAGFQLYFLFVMLQVYLLFPLVLWLVRATRRHHGLLVAASLALQVGITVTITYWHPPAPISNYWWHHYATFVPYQFFIVYGAVAAVHREKIGHWLQGKAWWLFSALVVTALLALGGYVFGVWFAGRPVHNDDSAFTPSLLPFLIVAIACLYAAAFHWSQHWRDFTPRMARIVSYAANRSFSVFLAHVLVLFFLLYPHKGDKPWLLAVLGQPWGTIVAYLGTLAGSLLLVEVLRRFPGAPYLTGRPRIPMRRIPMPRKPFVAMQRRGSSTDAAATRDEQLTASR